MKKITSLLPAVLGIALLIGSCSKDYITPDHTAVTAPGGMGVVTGVVHAANNNKVINHAWVHTTISNVLYATYTLSDGSFTLAIPAGTQTVCIQTGDGTLFQTCVTIVVTEGQTTHIPDSESALRLTANLAYIAGAYDQIEQLVHDTLGYAITEITDADLMNPSYLATFGAVFMNCNETSLLNDTAYMNLATFVESGSSVYVSDFAVSYLIGDYYTAIGCNRPGGFIPDSLLCTSKIGPDGTLPATNIVDTAFQSYMGTTTMDVEYDLAGWEVIQNFDPAFWDVIVSDATYGPLMLRNTSIGASEGGKIYYTTFHNEPNGAIGNSMRNMLEYVILNL